VADELGDRVRRIPDGETGPRSDWIVWQYPVLSARPEFEIGPPAPGFYRPLPPSPVDLRKLIAFAAFGTARDRR
jgi:hypothetical protein